MHGWEEFDFMSVPNLQSFPSYDMVYFFFFRLSLLAGYRPFYVSIASLDSASCIYYARQFRYGCFVPGRYVGRYSMYLVAILLDNALSPPCLSQ
jgi:hypothetical protein